MKNIIFCLLTFFFILSCKPSTEYYDINIESADAAYDRFELQKSENILSRLLETDSLSNDIKCQALRRLALYNWKYHLKYETAIKKLKLADSIGSSPFETKLLLNRIEREKGNYDQAIQVALAMENIAIAESEKNKAKTAYAQSVYEKSVSQLKNGQIIDKDLLRNTSQILLELLEKNAGMPGPSKLLFGISIILNDGASLMKAWKSYFHVQDIDRTYSYMQETARELNYICQDRISGNKAPDQEQFIRILARSRLYEFIPVYLLSHKIDTESFSPEVKDLIIYSNYLEEVGKETNEYYRLIAIDEAHERTYKKHLKNIRKKLWEDLSATQGREYSLEAFLKETESLFGAYGFEGNTASYKGFNLCLGHIVKRENTLIKQYGFQPEFTYTEIDMMISNTFPSWFWEDKASGGWATDKEIIRVREAYLTRPFAEWNSVNDPGIRNKTENDFEKSLSANNQNRLQIANIIEQKLNFDASEHLYKTLQNQGLSGSELKLAFLDTFKQYRLGASIMAHEGRHSIDRKYLAEEFEKWDNEEREFRAKLSQLIFATEPRYELAGMLDNIGDTGHVRANKRIITTLEEWVMENKEEINNYNEGKSAFSQIYLLSVEQIKNCFLAADPLNQ